MARVRERSRWFERRPTRWGVEPHRVAEARGEMPIAGLLEDACAHVCREVCKQATQFVPRSLTKPPVEMSSIAIVAFSFTRSF